MHALTHGLGPHEVKAGGAVKPGTVRAALRRGIESGLRSCSGRGRSSGPKSRGRDRLQTVPVDIEPRFTTAAALLIQAEKN